MKTDEQQEHDIIRKIVKGETELFAVLVNKYKDIAFSVTLSIVKNEQEAEDILQDVFLKVFRSLKSFKYHASFSTWLYRIVVNTCYKKLKKRKYDLDNTEIEKSGQLETPSDLLLKLERKKLINEVLQGMKTNESLVLRLFYLAEQNISEITEITQWKSSNVKVLLHRARKNFHTALDDLLGEEKKELL